MNKNRNDRKHILIVGSGSVGKRHAENLYGMGCKISCCDPRSDRLDELEAAVGDSVKTYADITSALDDDRYDGAVICSPTSFHPEQGVQALRAGIPVLMEKPLAISLDKAKILEAEVKKSETPLLMGYTWRWWPPLHRVRALLSEGLLGRLLYVQFYMSAHLADWHPWERYQDFFMAKQALGGGALLDESHWIDLMVWFFGMPAEVTGNVEKISSLEIETDDNVDFIASYQNNLRVYVHLDLYGRPHERFIRFVGEKGTLFWSSEPNEINISMGQSTGEANVENFSCERNDMFKGVADEFLSVIDGGVIKTCSLEDGLNAMHVIEAIRNSSASGLRVKV
jgi:predicted dehydrogenase